MIEDVLGMLRDRLEPRGARELKVYRVGRGDMCCEFTYNECLYLGIGPTDQGVFVNSIAERFGKLENDWSKKSDG